MKTKLILTALAMFFSVSLFPQTAQEIIQKSTDLIDISSMEMVSTLKIMDAKGNVRERQITTAAKKFGDANKMLIKFIAPADVKGTTLLVYDYDIKSDNMWIYMPALRKVRRIVSSEKGKSFMGSEFTNADMSKPNVTDFSYSILGKENFQGKTCWKIQQTGKNQTIQDENGYSKKISYVDNSSYLCYKVEFYDFSGKLQRVQLLSNYKKQSNGKYFAFLMQMENLQNGRKSIMTVDKFQAGSQLPESAFAPTTLDK
ncbi:MAG TPA: outer membrane lipoprotein-sorting protein [Paludibacter sp.]